MVRFGHELLRSSPVTPASRIAVKIQARTRSAGMPTFTHSGASVLTVHRDQDPNLFTSGTTRSTPRDNSQHDSDHDRQYGH